ncbi:MAG: hypothetical protein HHJ16_00310 [Polaromonas sp.]|uniref:hypothetical protein n=1 Tax=Polaromonas sp. TaxID=1869339 RepID=UPI0017AAA50A|nr:hypothetical protein [Polaromonas sp.]NMM08707.1 hypothetical protein [Polaromonas sp.]
MARNYSTKDFFRHMPNVLLARYFAGRAVFGEFDFAAMSETRHDGLFAAWLALPEAQRNTMDAEFHDIFEMSCEKGCHAILDEAKWHLGQDADPNAANGFAEMLAALTSHYARAMVTYLDHNTFWRGARHFYHADTVSHWRKRKNLPHNAASVVTSSILALANRIRTHFHQTEGRGNNCVVEPFRRGDLDYFFAYPEDYSQQSHEWVNGQFDIRPHNPAFEVIFVYSQSEGSLDLNYRGSYKAIEPLQAMFAETILQLPELPPDPKDSRVYDLGPLRQRNFEFTYDLGSGIESVVVKKLRLSSRATRGERISLEADTSQDPQAVYALLDRIQTAMPMAQYSVTQVDLAVSMIVEADRPPKTVNIHITYPNSCSLKYDELGLKLRDMLSASGIEPREPTELATPAAATAHTPTPALALVE